MRHTSTSILACLSFCISVNCGSGKLEPFREPFRTHVTPQNVDLDSLDSVLQARDKWRFRPSSALANVFFASSPTLQNFRYASRVDSAISAPLKQRITRRRPMASQHRCRLRSSVPASMQMSVAPESQLVQLASMTTLSIDTGDLDVIEKFASTGLISDATTNPLFVSQAGLSGDPRYQAFVDKAIAYAKANAEGSEAVLELAMDRLAVELGLEIVKLVPGYVSTEVDIRASFDTTESLRRARRIIAMYEAAGVDRSRILVKLAGTWEGIQAARELENEGIRCNITLIFGFIQAVAAAQAKAQLISPFPGRIKDWHSTNGGSPTYEPTDDPGVVCVSRMYAYYKKYGHERTICMPASWRPSRGTSDPAFAIDEIVALAGVDRMTIPPPLLELLAEKEAALPQMLDSTSAAMGCTDELVANGNLGESEFRMAMNADVAATTKLAEGINAFVGETLKLEAALKEKLK